jgi:hypothetical protein
MRSDILVIGDIVTIEVAKENREWGYNPCPDGTIAEVLGFSEIAYGRLHNFGSKPGVYTNRHWVKLRAVTLPKDSPVNTHPIGIHHIAGLADPEEAARRAKQPYMDKEFLRELPETPFWESDVVMVEGEQRVITRIDYGSLASKTVHGSPYPAYEVSDSLDAGWHQSFPAESMTLVWRGPVWNLAHGIPVTFASVEEEAKLASKMGHTKEARNPASGNYGWTHEEVLAALQQGTVHGLSVGRSPFSGGMYENAILFDDAELGERVRQLTLKGFGLSPRP